MKLFGKYADPYRDRRVEGPIIPDRNICTEEFRLDEKIAGDTISCSWLGHSSVLIRMGEHNFLIDPVFSEYASPVKGFGPRRFPGRVVRAEELPELDAVLITHNHYDHLDRETIKSIDHKVGEYLVPLGVKKNLKRIGVDPDKVREMDWWQEMSLGEILLVFVPTQHDSSRLGFDMNRTLWGSWLFLYRGYKIYHSGDGGYDRHFRALRERYGDVDTVFVECGQYNEKWHGIHMFPEESVEACMDLHAGMAIPIHWGTYCLSDHSWNEPIVRFRRMAEEKGLPTRVLRRNAAITMKIKNMQRSEEIKK